MSNDVWPPFSEEELKVMRKAKNLAVEIADHLRAAARHCEMYSNYAAANAEFTNALMILPELDDLMNKLNTSLWDK